MSYIQDFALEVLLFGHFFFLWGGVLRGLLLKQLIRFFNAMLKLVGVDVSRFLLFLEPEISLFNPFCIVLPDFSTDL